MNFFRRETASLHAAALILGAAALFAKLLGLARDRLLAARFGAGETLDVYYAAFQIPDLVYTLLLAGAASAAVLPVFLEYDRRGPEAAGRFISNLLTVFALGGALIAAVAIAFAPRLIAMIAPGFGPDEAALAVRLTRIMLLNPILIGVAGILSSVLQARHRFFVFALPPVVYNLGIIAGILAAVPLLGPLGLAYGVVAGGALQIMVQLPAVGALGLNLRPRLRFAEPGFVRVLSTALPRVAAIGMSQITLAALTAIASYFAAGSISVFKFSSNLLYVPVGLFGVSWALALFPKLSDASLAREGGVFRDQVAIGIRSILFWVLPAAALAVVLRAHVVRVVLGSGVFDWEDTRLVAATLAVLAIAIIAESLLPLLLRAFYALGRTAEPLLWDIAASLVTVAVAIGLSAFFAAEPSALHAAARVLRIGDLPAPRILGVAMAFAAGSVLNVVFLSSALARQTRVRLGVRLSFEGGAIASMAGASVLAGLAAYAMLIPFPALVATNTLPGIFLQGIVAGVAGLLVYGAALAGQGNEEITGLIQSFRQHLLRPDRTPRVYEAEKLDGESAK